MPTSTASAPAVAPPASDQPIDRPITTGEDYIRSLRGRGLRVFLFGELVEEPVDHPVIRPSINAVAETYDLALREPELATAVSPLTGERVNRFLHIAGSPADLVMQNKMQRKLGQLTGTCFQRCVGMDAFNALHSVTYEIDEKQRSVSLTESGNEKIEELLDAAGLLKGPLYDIENVTVVHHVNQALKAHTLFQRDRDYIVKGDQVVIIDEFTGRMMAGRRYSEGLHQALEAKEKVTIQPENQTLASITFQNYFRLYEKLAGMTGTAATEADEFMDIYGLDVVEIPTNLPVARLDEDDEIYRTADEKWDAIIREVEAAQKRGQPVLVGTVSIEKSELLSERLKAKGVPHQVLNARYHEQEA